MRRALTVVPKHFLAGCALHKLESRRLQEWIEYHLLVGFEHLYLFDNNDQDDGSAQIVRPYIEQGKVTSFRAVGMYPGMQVKLYGWLASQRLSTWLALFDLDEFILPIRCDDVRSVLEEFDRYAGVAANWRCFGTGGHVAAPQFVTESCTRASCPDWDNNRNVKSIIRPERMLALFSPHMGTALPGFSVVNERHEPINSDFSNFSDRTIVVNHYMLRSVEDFKVKAIRGPGDGHGNPYDQKYFKWGDRNEVEETRLADRFGAEVRRRCLAQP